MSLLGKVALVSGAARGMGRAHVLELAAAGADVIGFDLAAPVKTVPYPGATPEDLKATATAVEALGRRMISIEADVRDASAVDAVVAAGLREFGRIDIVVANAGVLRNAPSVRFSDDEWRTVIDINLTGAWHTIRSALPAMLDAGRGGAIVIIGSGAIGFPQVAAYSASKAGCVGLMKSLAAELASSDIRVNLIHPTVVATPMLQNEPTFRRARPDLEAPSLSDVEPQMHRINAMDVGYIDPEDVARAVRWLCSDEARYVTGVELKVDAGSSLQH